MYKKFVMGILSCASLTTMAHAGKFFIEADLNDEQKQAIYRKYVQPVQGKLKSLTQEESMSCQIFIDSSIDFLDALDSAYKYISIIKESKVDEVSTILDIGTLRDPYNIFKKEAVNDDYTKIFLKINIAVNSDVIHGWNKELAEAPESNIGVKPLYGFLSFAEYSLNRWNKDRGDDARWKKDIFAVYQVINMASSNPRPIRWMGEDPSDDTLSKISAEDLVLYRKGDSYYCKDFWATDSLEIDLKELAQGMGLNTLGKDVIRVKSMEIGKVSEETAKRPVRKTRTKEPEPQVIEQYDIDFYKSSDRVALRQYAAEKDYIFSEKPLTLKFKDFKLKYVEAEGRKFNFTVPFSLEALEDLKKLKVIYHYPDGDVEWSLYEETHYDSEGEDDGNGEKQLEACTDEASTPTTSTTSTNAHRFQPLSINFNPTGNAVQIDETSEGKRITTDNNNYATYQLASDRFNVISGEKIRVPYEITVEPDGIMSLGLLNTARNGWYDPEIVLTAGHYKSFFERIVPENETETSLVVRNYHLDSNGGAGYSIFTINDLKIEKGVGQ